MFSVLSKIRKLRLPIDIPCELFDRLVLPIALYGSEVWGFEDIAQIEVFHRKFLRNILGVHKSAASCMIYGKTGIYKLSNTVHMRTLNFWCSLLTGKQTKLSCTLYRLRRCMMMLRMLFVLGRFKMLSLSYIEVVLVDVGITRKF